MLARSSAEILDTSLDASIEGEENMDGLDWNGDVDDDDVPHEDQGDDVNIIGVNDRVPEVFNFESDLPDVTLPEEVRQYMESLSNETKKLEDELRECDELGLQYSPCKPHVSSALIPYDDFKEIEKEAALRGMSVEEFQQTILRELKENEFDEEEVDKEYEEFLQLQREFAELRADLPTDNQNPKVLPIEGAERCNAEVYYAQTDSEDIGQENCTETHNAVEENNNTEEPMALVTYVGKADNTANHDDMGAGTVSVNMAPLSNMRDFILEQLRRNEEFYERKRLNLVESIETLRHEEEKEMLRLERRRKELDNHLNEQKEMLRLKKETDEALLEKETKIRVEQTSQELSQHQLEIDGLNAALVEERQKFEENEKQWRDRLADTRAKAALKIQKVYRGLRTRRQHAAELAEMAVLRELRVKEKHTLRVMELEYEIKIREEEEAKSKAEAEEKRKRLEEERRKEKEKKEKEEADRIAGLIQKEKDRMEEEARQAEVKRKKEKEEEQQKIEEKKRKEEEMIRKEEEKRLKEEEKRRQKEEDKQKKEEEKKKKEEDKRKKKEEKQKAEEEKKKLKQEEKEMKEREALKNPDIESKSSNASEHNQEKNDSKKIYEKFINQEDKTNRQTDACSTSLAGSEDLHSLKNNSNDTSKEHHICSVTVNETKPEVLSAKTANETKSSQSEVQSDSPIKESKPAVKEPSKSALDSENLTPGGSLQNQQLQDQKAAEKIPLSSQNQEPSEISETSPLNASILEAETKVPVGTSSSKRSAVTSSQSYTPRATAAAGIGVASANTASTDFPSPQLQPHPPAVPRESSPPQPSASELKRLEWIKNCIPWSKVSNEPWKLSQGAGKVHKKPTSAKKLPAVAESVILTAAQAETLRQVSSVTLRDLPGCSLSTLSQCWSLRYLTVTHCRLLCLDGLSQCRHLLYINAEDNLLEYVDLKDLGSLQVAKLARNNLGSVHGFEGCINLRWLDLSHNSITRLGSGLSPLRRLHTLDLSHNQLVSAQGLELVVTCQSLKLDQNYLQAVQGLDKLCLLTELSLAGNNLLQVPELKNQVLLQRLNVNENSIKSMEGLANSWLPLLMTLSCEKNLLESCKGLNLLDNLEVLDVGFNQIEDLESLTTYLHNKLHLRRLVVKGNPLVDVYADEYSSELASILPALNSIDGVHVESGDVKKPGMADTNTWVNTEFLEMCQAQIKLHKQLKEEFDKNIQSLLGNKSVTSESLCGTYFSFCDTSFKMASEHRSSHEYGEMSLSSIDSRITGHPKSDNPQAMNGVEKTSEKVFSQKSKVTANGQCLMDKKALFDQATADSQFQQNGLSSARSSQDFSVGQSGMSKYSQQQQMQQSSQKQRSEMFSSSQKKKEKQAYHSSTSQHKLSASSAPREKFNPSAESAESSTDSDSDEGVDGGSNFYCKGSLDNNSSRSVGSTKVHNGYKHLPHPPTVPPVMSYTNEKDKFEMALNSNSARSKPNNNSKKSDTDQDGTCGLGAKGMFDMALKNTTSANMQEVDGRDRFEKALQRSSQLTSNSDTKEIFNGALQKGLNGNIVGVPANVVGFQLAEGNGMTGEDIDLAALGLEGEFDLDNLDFDIDKFLDLDTEDLDEFLEKGWRPEESPQIPQSSYPVLGKITPAGDSGPTLSNTNNHQYSYPSVSGKPPQHPSQAWRNSPAAEFKGRPSQSPYTAGVTALPPQQPSPSPSSVASAAETLGGGTVKSKKDELTDEWGFKDSRTAELMMARAKKMKWNAERKKKLSKLDPQQRLHLFRKLEESGKIQPVRTAAPAKVLPRKEYFQAREEEAQRQHQERRVEEQTRVHRTYEWLHTQVGDHPVSTSRINAGHAPVYSMNEIGSVRQSNHKTNQDNRKWSPGSDHMDSVSQSGANRPRQGRRFSIGDSQYSGQTPSLPPIQVGSAPSSHKSERISFRDTPVERSGGWGGGKRRGQYK